MTKKKQKKTKSQKVSKGTDEQRRILRQLGLISRKADTKVTKAELIKFNKTKSYLAYEIKQQLKDMWFGDDGYVSTKPEAKVK